MSIPAHLTTPPSGDVTVWTKPDCVQCRAVKRRLDEAHVPYTERDITAPENERDLAYFKGIGLSSAPITEHGAKAVPGYIPARIDEIIAAWREGHPEDGEAA